MEFVKIFGKYMNSRYIKALFGGGGLSRWIGKVFRCFGFKEAKSFTVRVI